MRPQVDFYFDVNFQIIERIVLGPKLQAEISLGANDLGKCHNITGWLRASLTVIVKTGSS